MAFRSNANILPTFWGARVVVDKRNTIKTEGMVAYIAITAHPSLYRNVKSAPKALFIALSWIDLVIGVVVHHAALFG